jgi:hypothetical protein
MDRRNDIDDFPITLFLIVFRPVWIAVCTPMVLWIAVSALYNAVAFFFALYGGHTISAIRWLTAGALFGTGVVVQIAFLLLLLTGQSKRQKLKRLAVLSLPILMMLSVPMVLIGNAIAWVLSSFLPAQWVSLSMDGPMSLGQAMGQGLGLIFGPFLFFTGLAKGVLAAGHPLARFGCSTVQEAVSLGLIDASSFYGLLKALVTLPGQVDVLEKLGFNLRPPIYSLNWWGTVSVAGYVEGAAEITVCYASGELDG